MTPAGDKEEDDEAEEKVRESQGRRSTAPSDQVSFEHDVERKLST